MTEGLMEVQSRWECRKQGVVSHEDELLSEENIRKSHGCRRQKLVETVKMAVFLVVAPCSLVEVYQCFIIRAMMAF
jgi:hypothetical protein